VERGNSKVPSQAGEGKGDPDAPTKRKKEDSLSSWGKKENRGKAALKQGGVSQKGARAEDARSTM